MWLRTKKGLPKFTLGYPNDAKRPRRVIDDNAWHIVFREEFHEKKLWHSEWDKERDYTNEVLSILPDDMRGQYSLKTERLIRRFGNEIKSNGAFLLASPGDITAIMGPSGAGKTVFLKMICGYDRPSSVIYSGGAEAPMNDNAICICGETGEKAFRYLGYVPQGDVLYPELTTEQSLRYRMRLRFGNLLTEDDITQCIHHVCFELLKLEPNTIKMQIGQMDWIGPYPSGGQRRRINIAHELVLEPHVLILDEPTSGLSSKDSEELMDALKGLAYSKQLCIVMTIHQPSENMFKKIEDLLLFVSGGSLAYYGRRSLALDWLRLSTTKPEEDVPESENDAETILNMISVPSAKIRYPNMFENFLMRCGGTKSKITTLI